MSLSLDVTNVHNVLSKYLKEPLARPGSATKNTRQIQKILQNKEMNNLSQQQQHPKQLALEFIEEAFDYFKLSKSIETGILDTTNLCFEALSKKDDNKLDYLMIIEKQLILTEILMNLRRWRESFFGIKSAFLQFTNVLPYPQQKLTLELMLEGFEFKPMIYTENIVKIMVRLHVLIIEWITYNQARSELHRISAEIPSPQRIVELTSSGSNFYDWFKALSLPESQNEGFRLSQFFVILNSTNKTVIKLCYSFKALEFLSFAGETHPDLVTNTIEIFNLMVAKHRNLVHRHGSLPFYEVCQSYSENGMPLGPLKKLVVGFKNIGCEANDLDWDQFLVEGFDANESFQKLDITDDNIDVISLSKTLSTASSDDLIRFIGLLKDTDNYALVHNEEFCVNIMLTLKRLDSNNSIGQEFIIALLQFIKAGSCSIGSFKTIHLNIFDFITISIKNLDVQSLSPFAYDALNLLYIALKDKSQPKRLRNFSNLLFHAGGKLLSTNRDEAINCWMNCINIEYEMMINLGNSKLNEGFVSLKGKSERICHLLLETSNYTEALIFLSKIFTCYESFKQVDNIFEYQSVLSKDISIPIKLMTKIIVETKGSVPLKRAGAMEITQVLVILETIKLLNCTNITSRQDIISKLIIQVKNGLQDNGLFLFLLSSVSFIVSFNITFKSIDGLEFQSNSEMYQFKGLISSHIYLLQCYPSANELDQESLYQSFNEMLKWIEYNNSYGIVSSYEFNIFCSLVEALRYHQLYAYASYLLESYMKIRILKMSKEQVLALNTMASGLKLSLRYSLHVGKILTHQSKVVDNSKDNFQKLNHYLLKLEYLIEIENIEESKQVFQFILSVIQNDDSLVISKQPNRSKVAELLLMLSKFSRLSSKLNSKLSNHVDAVTSCKRSLRILQSVLKNFLINGVSNSGLSLSFKLNLKLKFSENMLKTYETLMDLLLHLGLGKDFEYYESEFETFLSCQPSPFVKSYYLFLFAEYQIYKNNTIKASELLSRASSTYNDLKFIDKFLDLKRATSNELYYQYLGDAVNNMNHRGKVDQAISQLMYNDTADYSDLNLAIQGQYNYKNDSFLLLKEWIYIEFRRTVFVLKGSDSITNNLPGSKLLDIKTMFTNSLQSLSTDPILSGLKESVISTESTKPLMSSPSKSLVANSAIGCFQKCQQEIGLLLKENTSNRIEQEDLVCTLSLTLSILGALSTSIIDRSQHKIITYWEDIGRHQILDIDRDLTKSNENGKQLIPYDLKENLNGTFQTLSAPSTFFGNLKQALPFDWMVVSIDICPISGDLILTKLKATSSTPFTVRLPLNRHSARGVEKQCLSFEDAIEELSTIISESDDTTKPEVTSKITDKKDKIDWWGKRKALDKRVGDLLDTIESDWLCGFNGLFNTKIIQRNELEEFKSIVLNILSRYLPSRNPMVKQKKEKELVELSDAVFELFLQVNDIDNNLDALEDLVYFMLDTISFHGETIAYDEIEIDQLISDIFNELKVIQQRERSISNIDEDDKNSIKHVVLIPSMACTKIPWESISSLRSKSVSRMPSLQLLTKVLTANQHLLNTGIDPSKGYYIINPGGDLKRTESNFKDKFSTLAGWNGIVGMKPFEEQIKQGLNTSDLYVYIGHGGGEQYIKSKTIKGMDKLPPSLLIGCSSGNLTVEGIFKPFGTVYNYLIGGSPMVLANLWDVTDKDIDKFTLSFFKKWGLFVDYDSFDSFNLFDQDEYLNAGESIAESRDVCLLKYLNGAAPVLYGLPLKIKEN